MYTLSVVLKFFVSNTVLSLGDSINENGWLEVASG